MDGGGPQLRMSGRIHPSCGPVWTNISGVSFLHPHLTSLQMGGAKPSCGAPKHGKAHVDGGGWIPVG